MFVWSFRDSPRSHTPHVQVFPPSISSLPIPNSRPPAPTHAQTLQLHTPAHLSAPDAASTTAYLKSAAVAPSYPLFPQLGSSSSTSTSSSSYHSSCIIAMNPETCTKCRSLDIITGSFSLSRHLAFLSCGQKPVSPPRVSPTPTPSNQG